MLFSLAPRETPRLAQLKKVALFSDLSLKQLEILDHMLHERSYLEGEFVFDEGDEGQALFIVLSGKIRTWRASAMIDQAVDFGPGAFFGELALLEDAPRSTSARAEQDSCLVALFRTDFISLLETETLIGAKISYALALDLARKLRRIITTSPQLTVAMKAHYESGPVVWLCVLTATCLALYVFQSILWLVIPSLLAIILYYLTLPLVIALTHKGLRREVAVMAVMAALILVAMAIIIFFFPILVQDIGTWRSAIKHYVDGGMNLLSRTINTITHYVPMLGNLNLPNGQSKWDAFLADLAQKYTGDLLILILHWMPSLLLVPYLTYFLLRDGAQFKGFLVRAIPNAFFERALLLFHRVDAQMRRYFHGLMVLTMLDCLCLATGLWFLGISSAALLGLITAVLAWIPYIGSVLGCLLVLLVAATDFPANGWIAYEAIALFLIVRLLDDFIFMPYAIGRNLQVHPVVSVLMIFIGGAVAGIAGLLLVMPVLGVLMVFGQVIGELVTEERVLARHQHAMALHRMRAKHDLVINQN